MKENNNHSSSSSSSNTCEFKWDIHETKLIMGRNGCSAVSIDDHRMVITGGHDGYKRLSSVELFDSMTTTTRTTRTTTKLPNMNNARSSHVSIVHGNYVYVIGGFGNNGRFDFVERLNISTLSDVSVWERVVPMKEKRSSFAAAIHNEHIYVFGGCVVAGDGDVVVVGRSERYNVFTNQWESIPSMKQERYNHVAFTVGDNKIFVLGEEKKKKNDYNTIVSMEIFDIPSQSWEVDDTTDDDDDDSMISIPFVDMKAVLVHNHWIVIFGQTPKTIFRTTEDDDDDERIFIFDTQTHTWTTITNHNNNLSMNKARQWFAASVLEQTKIFIVGGRDRVGHNRLDTIEFGDLSLLLHSLMTKKDPTTTARDETLKESPVETTTTTTTSVLEQRMNDLEIHPNEKKDTSSSSNNTKSVRERVKLLEVYAGIDDDNDETKSSTLRHRIEKLEMDIMGEISSGIGKSIIQRVECLENEFFGSSSSST